MIQRSFFKGSFCRSTQTSSHLLLFNQKNCRLFSKEKVMSTAKRQKTSQRSVISTPDAPKAIGPYSQGIKASGNFVFVSGQIPLDPKTGELVNGDIEAQAEQSLKNLGAILTAGNSSFENVVKVSVFLQKIEDWPKVNIVYSKYFTKDHPARAAFAVGALPKGALVEIEAIALVDD